MALTEPDATRAQTLIARLLQDLGDLSVRLESAALRIDQARDPRYLAMADELLERAAGDLRYARALLGKSD